MHTVKPLAPEQLYARCNPDDFSFSTTAELPGLTGIIGQQRATEAVRFGINIQRKGYNLYVMAPPGSGKQTLVRQFLHSRAATRPVPDDWCYVNNFTEAHKPRALRLPPGRVSQFRQDMEKWVDELSVVLPAAFASEDYHNRLHKLEKALTKRQEDAIDQLIEKAEAQEIRLLRTEDGFAFTPLHEGEAIEADAFAKLPKPTQQVTLNTIEKLQEALQDIVHQFPLWQRDTREQIKQLNCQTTQSAVQHLINQLKESYRDLPKVITYLDSIEQDVIDNVANLLPADEDEETLFNKQEAQQRYQLTVLVDNAATQGAPIVYLDNPAYLNLVGRAEHIAQLGTLLKPGALHQANGGYLLIDANKLLTHPFAWEGLKRALYAGEIRAESLEKMLSLASTIALEPQSIPLDVKVVLMGDRLTYYLLHEEDPDFAELFKVAADLDEDMPRSAENQQLYAQLIANLACKESLRPFDRQAVARIIEHGSRLAEDHTRLSTHMRSLADVLREADYWAEEAGRATVGLHEVQQAINQQIRRSSRIHDRLLEEIQSGTLSIATSGSAVGQVNGLSLFSMGSFRFGQPSRITATVHIGEDGVIDIEREVELGGTLHSKGVLILTSFLAQRYATDHPLALSASLVFEQSHGPIDGDSASLAELCALLSALSALPADQSLAITGAVSQYGEVQPIGGVNEKVEGFFAACQRKGLSGKQGVIIPAHNAQHLMLNADIVQAAEQGRFHIYPVHSVDQALSLLLGTPAGTCDTQGNWTANSINASVQERLHEMARIRVQFAESSKDKEHDESASADE